MTVDALQPPLLLHHWNRLKGAVIMATAWGRAAPVEACLMLAR
jgi:hypothetical protein